MKEKQIIEVSSKHVVLRTIIFVLAAVIAIFAFTRGVMSLGDKEPGWQEVSAKANADCPLYANGIELKYYCEGTSSQIRRTVATVSEQYSNALSLVYKLTDPVNRYEDFINMAYINQHRGESIEIPKVLYDMLKDAYAKTLEDKGYSLFSGDLLKSWTDILVLEEPWDFDPLYNDNEKQRLQSLASGISNAGNFTLTFDDESSSVVFSTSDAYESLCLDIESGGQTLDLGLMRESYMIGYVMQTLESLGYKDATIVTNFGNYASLVENTSEFSFWAIDVLGNELMYYTIEKDGKEYLRHQFCDIKTGLPNNVLERYTVDIQGSSPVDACYHVICATALEKESQVEQYSKGLFFKGLLSTSYSFQNQHQN